MLKKQSSGGSVRVQAHTRAGKKVRAYTRGNGAMGRALGRRAKGILTTSKMVHALGNPTKKSLSKILGEHKSDFSHNAKYVRRGIDRKGYSGGKKMSYLISATAAKKIK